MNPYARFDAASISQPAATGWAASPSSVPVRIQQIHRRLRSRPPASVPRRTCVIFTAPFPQARHVQLIGEFTDWSRSPIEMSKSGARFWFAAIHLPPGDHRYAYLVDGEHRLDPDAPQFGSSTGAISNLCRVTGW